MIEGISLAMVATLILIGNGCPIEIVRTESINTLSLDDSQFRRLGGTDYKKVLDCDDGYAYYVTNFYTAPFTTKSDLYLAHVITNITPGHAARANGDKNYKDYYLSNAYIHLTTAQYLEDDKVGGEIVPKDFWPRSSTLTTTVTSSFGGSIVMNTTGSQGIDLGNGASITVSNSSSNGVTITFDKSQSTVTPDPVLSFQLASNNPYEAQWSISVINEEVAGSISYSMDLYYLFEMSNEVSNTNRNSFLLEYEIMYQGQYKNLFGWHDGWEFNNTVQFYCFL